MAGCKSKTQFDPGGYIDAVALLGFRPYLKVNSTGKLTMREQTPSEPLTVKERGFYRKLVRASVRPRNRAALLKELARRGLVQWPRKRGSRVA